jgi:DNA-directed RNA polymerase specialized sigma24 family protein
VGTFEDAVIFVHDVEKVLERLETFDQALIAKIIFQDHNYEETARLLNCGKRTVGRRFPDAIDRLTELFLEVGLLERMVQLDG